MVMHAADFALFTLLLVASSCASVLIIGFTVAIIIKACRDMLKNERPSERDE